MPCFVVVMIMVTVENMSDIMYKWLHPTRERAKDNDDEIEKSEKFVNSHALRAQSPG